MTSYSQDIIFQANHFFLSRRYEDAIGLLESSISHILEEEKEFKSQIYTLIGKCYFEKFEQRDCFNQRFYFANKNCRDYSYFINTYYTYRRMTKKALNYFVLAVQHDPNNSEGYYWKGKCLDCQGESQEAFQSFTKAAALANKKYRSICCEYFEKHKTLSFMPSRPFSSIKIEEALSSCSDENSYIRMEVCSYLLNMLLNSPSSLLDNELCKIANTVSPLAGYRISCVYIPLSGDPDARVRQLARNVLDICFQKQLTVW